MLDNTMLTQLFQGPLRVRVMDENSSLGDPIGCQSNAIINQNSLVTRLVMLVPTPASNDIDDTCLWIPIHNLMSTSLPCLAHVIDFHPQFPRTPTRLFGRTRRTQTNARQNVGLVFPNVIPQFASIARPCQFLVEAIGLPHEAPHAFDGKIVGGDSLGKTTNASVKVTQDAIEVAEDLEGAGLLNREGSGRELSSSSGILLLLLAFLLTTIVVDVALAVRPQRLLKGCTCTGRLCSTAAVMLLSHVVVGCNVQKNSVSNYGLLCLKGRGDRTRAKSK
mmetsp:Transcript_5355/g.8794  ORF Transcript_5355/g.8794 Transcript_5355/m.8794 type:complete len:277 (-) Transcript_5355:264-1094(-)